MAKTKKIIKPLQLKLAKHLDRRRVIHRLRSGDLVSLLLNIAAAVILLGTIGFSAVKLLPRVADWRGGPNLNEFLKGADEPFRVDAQAVDGASVGQAAGQSSDPAKKSTVKSPGNQSSGAAQSTVSPKRFNTLPPGSALPSDADCAARVQAADETRPANAATNATKGSGGNTEFPRVTGNFTGTTDEILQWAACKWGIDEDTVRAQTAKESWWFQRTMGDFTADTTICAPGHQVLGQDGKPGLCPESVGVLQVRWFYHQSAFINNSALNSTAYNADYAYAVWRDCFEGNMTWLNDVEKGGIYAAGDEWGCVGEWFSGRWLTPATMPYINAVKDYKNQRIWLTEDFITAP